MPYAFINDNKSTNEEYGYGGDHYVPEHCPSVDHFLNSNLEWVYDPLHYCYRKRVEAYGLVESQMDEIFHNGIDAWKQRITDIKLQYPKPGV